MSHVRDPCITQPFVNPAEALAKKYILQLNIAILGLTNALEMNIFHFLSFSCLYSKSERDLSLVKST